MPENRQGSFLRPIIKVSTVIIADRVTQMPTAGQLFPVTWAPGSRLDVKRNLLLVTRWLHYTRSALPHTIRPEFWGEVCRTMNKMHICANPQDSLPQEHGLFKESGQIPQKSSESSYVFFYFPRFPAASLACWQHAQAVICQKQPPLSYNY